LDAGLIKPKVGRGLCYVDGSQQEFGVAAALSKDRAMQAAYNSGDPYLAFAKQAGAAPEHATKASHRAVREQFEGCALAVQYQMGAESLAARIGQPVYQAAELLRLHRATYPVYWRWSDAAMDYARLNRELPSVFGWRLHVTAATKSRTIANFPMQANRAEMLRLACCLTTERGVEVCAPVNDALLIEAPLGGSFDDLLERAGIQNFRFHDLRHTFASWYMMNGGDLYELAKILGHSNIKMTERYAKLGRAHMAKTSNTAREIWKLLGSEQAV
jgi:DNA polymerase-1